jgi:hypothetical protein
VEPLCNVVRLLVRKVERQHAIPPLRELVVALRKARSEVARDLFGRATRQHVGKPLTFADPGGATSSRRGIRSGVVAAACIATHAPNEWPMRSALSYPSAFIKWSTSPAHSTTPSDEFVGEGEAPQPRMSKKTKVRTSASASSQGRK